MQAKQAKLLDLLKNSPQFVIPIYQRNYSWTEKECRQLWKDVIRCGKSEHIPIHFIGSVVYVESGQYQVTNQKSLLVIDGQQRLTSITLLLSALAKAVENTEPVNGFSQIKIRHYYLLNPLEEGERRFKLLLSKNDKETLTALVEGENLPQNFSIRVNENYLLFQKWIDENKEDITTLCLGLDKLMIVDIALHRDQDNPQLIFESMNSTGKDLSQADLIRNFILMGLEPDFQTRLYEQFWRPMEVGFGQEAYDTYFDGFMRHYLTVKTGKIPNINAVYEEYKDYFSKTRQEYQNDKEHVESLVNSLKNYSRYFCAMVLNKEINQELKRAFDDLRELKVDIVYPFLLELYDDYENTKLPLNDFVIVVRWIEAYVFRRAVCGIPTNSMNRTFAVFSKDLKKEHYLESIAANFLFLPTYRRFPSDTEFEHEIQNRNLYNFGKSKYWLRRLENYGRRELVSVGDYTIEHIMPQNENLSEEWRKDLGDNWQETQQNYLHTLGNLTLTGYNSEYSDRPFKEKRDLEGKGFKFSPLKMNDGLGSLEVWNEDAIKIRASKLAKKALEVWKIPVLSKDVFDSYCIGSQQVGSELEDTDEGD
ncbi:MAG: DUF262 domain-containing protein [Methylococcaceae bacterium]